MKPKAHYDLKKNQCDHLGRTAWAALLDQRYKIEVIPDKGETHSGTFVIFDGGDKDRLVHQEKVAISYGAVFGADAGDIALWQDKACAIIDALPKSSQ